MIALVVWVLPRKQPPVPSPEVAEVLHSAPGVGAPVGAVPAIRVVDELEKAGSALRESSRTFTEPADGASQVLAMVPATLRPLPAVPPAVPGERIARSLAEIPEAARAGLEPVTDSAQKAFTRLLRDVGAMQPAKPKS